MRNTRDSCDQMQEEKEDIQGERVLLRYDQLQTNNLKIKCNAKKNYRTTRSPVFIVSVRERWMMMF